jgi:hypothetical protein
MTVVPQRSLDINFGGVVATALWAVIQSIMRPATGRWLQEVTRDRCTRPLLDKANLLLI